MARAVVACDDRTVLLLDSVTEIRPEDAGHVVVAASHGGSSAVRYALGVPLAGCFFNDAGIGKDQAGITGLTLLACPTLAYSHASARIGDAADGWQNGVVTALNPAAVSAGLQAGMTVQAAARALLRR
ncbi:hypothetical protein [Ferrovibrio sp.]|uniref:hypothetical protein n=1 Tax=Ferrovibrio sp. TaxID=1917215 RepID=UPI00261E71F4|nr:hypothetical protein [Ferrovibrio sp.]